MEESAKRRRAELIEEINRHRKRLRVLEHAERVPSLASVETAAQVRQMMRDVEEKLRSLNEELHNLNVQLIRDGLSADAP